MSKYDFPINTLYSPTTYTKHNVKACFWMNLLQSKKQKFKTKISGQKHLLRKTKQKPCFIDALRKKPKTLRKI